MTSIDTLSEYFVHWFVPLLHWPVTSIIKFSIPTTFFLSAKPLFFLFHLVYSHLPSLFFLIILSRHITKPNLVSDISIDFVWLPVPVVVFPFAWSCDSDETGYFGGINPFLYFLGFFPFVVFIIACPIVFVNTLF